MTLPEAREEDDEEAGREEPPPGLEPREELMEGPLERDGEDGETLGLEDDEGRERVDREEDPEPLRTEEGAVVPESRREADDRPDTEGVRPDSRRPPLLLVETAMRPELGWLRREAYPAADREAGETFRRAEVVTAELRVDDAEARADGYFLIVSSFFTADPDDWPSLFLIFSAVLPDSVFDDGGCRIAEGARSTVGLRPELVPASVPRMTGGRRSVAPLCSLSPVAFSPG